MAQSKRIYEILRLHYTKINVPEEMEVYKKLVLTRLEKPLKRTKRDITKLTGLLDENELAVQMDPETIQEQVEKDYENTLEVYKNTLNRLMKFEKKFLF